MSNVFENFDAMELEEMRFEVALFKSVSVANFANEVKTTVKNRGTKFINIVSGFWNKPGVEETKVEKISELLEYECNELKETDTETLHQLMLEEVKGKLVELGVPEDKLVDEEAISIYTVKEAALSIPGGIGKEASIGQKADDIAQKFNKKQVDDIKNNISMKRMNRDLLAHLVWKTSVHMDGYFPKELEASEDEIHLDEEFWSVLRNKSIYAEKVEGIERDKKNTETLKDNVNAAIAELEEKLESSKNRLLELEIQNAAEEEKNTLNTIIELSEKQLSERKKELEEYETKLTVLKYDREKLDEQKEQDDRTEEEYRNGILEIIKIKWKEQFTNLNIAEEAVGRIVNTYPLKERKVLECALKELENAPEPELLTEGDKLKDDSSNQQVFSFVINDKAIGRILFEKKEDGIWISKILKVRRA